MQMHLSRFRATLEQVGELDPKSADRSDKAMAVVIALPNFKECRDKSIQMGLPPVPPGQLAAVKQANALITRAQTKRIAHDVKAAQTLLKQVFSRLETIKYLPLTAYAHLEAGQLAVARVKHKIAEKHFRAAIKASAKSKAAHFEARGWLSLVFTIGHRLGRHKDALALRDAAEAAVARAGNEPVLVARLAGNIGLILKSSGDYRGAHKQLLRSVALFERENGKKHVDTATARNNLAMVLNGLGKSKQAYKQLLEVLAIREELVGKDHPDVATTLNDMGDAAHNLGRLKLAKKHIERALTIRKTKLGEMSSRTGNTENNLAIVLGDLGQHQKALAHAKRAVAIAEKHFGKNHPEVAGPLNTMGNQLRDLGQQKAAWQAYARGMALIEWGWGKKHVAAAPFKENLARILVRMGLHDRAIVFINQAIDLRRAGQGQYHPELINAIALRGSFNLEASRFELAIADFEKQVELSRKTFGEKSSDYARALFNLAIGQEKQKQYLKAKYNYYRAVRVLEASAPKNVLRVNALRGMADVAYAQKAYAEAEKHYRDAAALARLLRAGPRGAILHLLGNALVRQKKWKEATLAFKQALPLRKGSDPAQLALTELRLAEALWDGKLDRKRARELAKTARERFVQAGKRAEDNVKEVDAWLRKHR
jgi:tetratricopeptide (TPR) repeat protein